MTKALSPYLNLPLRTLAQATIEVEAARELRRQLAIAFPPPARPSDEIADRGTVRLGDANVTFDHKAI